MPFREHAAIRRGAALALILACSGLEGGTATPSAAPSKLQDPALVELLGLVEGVSPPPRWQTPEDSPLWPQVTFVRAESLLRSGEINGARTLYQILVSRAAVGVAGDSPEVSSLAIFALWRWVNLLYSRPEAPKSGELRPLLAQESRLRSYGLGEGIYRFGFLDALPELEQEIARKLAVLCFRAGEMLEAQSRFMSYLRLAPGAELGSEEQALLASRIAAGQISRAQVAELRARRLEELRRYDEAIPMWRAVLRDGDPRQGHVARLRIAILEARLFTTGRAELDRLLTTVIQGASDTTTLQEALYARAGVWSREGSGQDLDRYLADLDRILESGAGPRADDALFRLATHRQRLAERDGSPEEFDRALELFKRLRELVGPNDWQDSAFFQPAMLHLARRGPDDLRNAHGLLRGLLRERPDGPLVRAAGFWQARILDELGETALATSAYRAVASARPYDYYALRARMHLEEGARASGRLWPGPETRRELARAYQAHDAYAGLSGTTAHHRRLAAAADSGLYRTLLERRRSLRERTPGERLQNLPLESIDQGSDLTWLALLLTLRQDAVAAAARPTRADNALEVHAAVSLRAGDHPLAVSMALGSLAQGRHGARPDQDPRFLQSAYPPVYKELFEKAARAEGIPPELLYALSRRESLFDPAAISTYSALGLFQFVPSTFEALDRRWRLLEGTGTPDAVHYLLDPERNALLGARWLTDELIYRQNCVLLKEMGYDCTRENRADPTRALVTTAQWFHDAETTLQQRVVLLALMEHSRGYTAVRGWLDRWRAEGRDRDLEYMIETAGAAETRVLVRGVITDAAIAAAIGLFAGPEPVN